MLYYVFCFGDAVYLFHFGSYCGHWTVLRLQQCEVVCPITRSNRRRSWVKDTPIGCWSAPLWSLIKYKQATRLTGPVCSSPVFCAVLNWAPVDTEQAEACVGAERDVHSSLSFCDGEIWLWSHFLGGKVQHSLTSDRSERNLKQYCKSCVRNVLALCVWPSTETRLGPSQEELEKKSEAHFSVKP